MARGDFPRRRCKVILQSIVVPKLAVPRGKVRVSVSARFSDLSEKTAAPLKSSPRSASERRCECCCLYRDGPTVTVSTCPIQLQHS